MTRKILFMICGMVLLIQACSPHSYEIVPKPPIGSFAHLSCKQLETDLRRVSEALDSARRLQDSRASRDEKLTWAFSILFFPALVFLVTENEPYNVAELKGRRNALQITQVAKC